MTTTQTTSGRSKIPSPSTRPKRTVSPATVLLFIVVCVQTFKLCLCFPPHFIFPWVISRTHAHPCTWLPARRRYLLSKQGGLFGSSRMVEFTVDPEGITINPFGKSGILGTGLGTGLLGLGTKHRPPVQVGLVPFSSCLVSIDTVRSDFTGVVVGCIFFGSFFVHTSLVFTFVHSSSLSFCVGRCLTAGKVRLSLKFAIFVLQVDIEQIVSCTGDPTNELTLRFTYFDQSDKNQKTYELEASSALEAEEIIAKISTIFRSKVGDRRTSAIK